MAVDIGTLYTRIEARTDQLNQAETSIASFAKRAAGYFATILTVAKVTEFVKNATLATARFDTMGIVMENVGKRAGYTSSQLKEYEMSLRKAGISMTATRETITKMAQANIDLTKSMELARVAQNAAVIGNINSSEAFERMIYGIQSGQIEVLRTIGINVQFEESYKKLAKQLNINKDQLTESERVQARTNVVLEAGTKILGTYEAAMETPGKKFLSMTRYIEDLTVSIGRVFQPSFGTLVDSATKSLKDMQKNIEDNSETWDQYADNLNTAIKAVLEMASAVNKLSDAFGSPGLAQAAILLGILTKWGVAASTAAGGVLVLNNEMEKLDGFLGGMSIQHGIKALNEHLKANQNIMDVFTGKRDWNTGEEFNTELQKIDRAIAQLKNKKAPIFPLFPDEWQVKEQADKNIAEMERLVSERNKILSGMKDTWQTTTPSIPDPTKPTPEPRPEGEGTSRKQDWNQVRERQLSFLKSIEERKLSVIQGSIALEQEYTRNAYEMGLTDYQTYLEKKNSLTVHSLELEVEARKRELAAAQEVASQITPITGKGGEARPDKDATAEYEALQRVEEAKTSLIEVENQLTMAKVQGARETVDWNREQQRSYKEIEIQLMEMQGKNLEAAIVQQDLDWESVERQQLLEAALKERAGAQEAVNNLIKQDALEIANLEFESISRSKQAQQQIAEINGEYDKSRQLQIELLDIEIKRAELNGETSAQINLLKEQRGEIEKLTTAWGAFGKGWEDIVNQWKDTATQMQEIAQNTATAMHSAFSDLFTDAINGELKTVGDYARSFLKTINQMIADALAQSLVSSVFGQSAGSSIGGLVGIFAGAFGGGGSTAAASQGTGWHGGGVVGVDPPSFTRNVGSWSGVPRLHEGTGFGEYKAILKRSEVVLTEGQQDIIKDIIKYRRPGSGEEDKNRLFEKLNQLQVDTRPEVGFSQMRDNQSINVSVPVNVEGGDKKLAADLQRNIEKTVIETIRRHS